VRHLDEHLVPELRAALGVPGPVLGTEEEVAPVVERPGSLFVPPMRQARPASAPGPGGRFEGGGLRIELAPPMTDQDAAEVAEAYRRAIPEDPRLVVLSSGRTVVFRRSRGR
jgi:hypothetical protein